MHVSAATFGPPFPDTEPGFVLRIEATGRDFELRAAPVVAQVGDVPVEYLHVKVEGDGFVGLLRAFPKIGDKLQVGYLDTPLITTDIAFRPPVG